MKDTFYYPILKWKQGEYTALSKLADGVKDRICPIIEITPSGYDQESQENRKNVNEHIKDIGIRLHKCWEGREAFVDISNLDIMPNQKPEYITKIFNNYSDSFCLVAPVIYLDETEVCLKLYKSIIKKNGLGCLLRIKFHELNDDFMQKVNFIKEILDIDFSKIDILVDMEKLNVSVDDEYEIYDIWSMELLKINYLKEWRSFIIAGSSFPDELTDGTVHNRYEWRFYKNFIDKYTENSKEPKFSDYYVLKPEHSLPVDGKKIKSKAKLRYTTDNGWYFDKVPPKSKKKKGGIVEESKVKMNEEYKPLCRNLVSCPFFRGGTYSEGDKYIYERATNEKISAGNPTKWIEASTNQHITKVVNDLSTLFDFSLHPLRGLLALLEGTLQ